MAQKIFIKTFGCQMNEYDSNRIFDSVKKIGFEKTDNYEDANCYLLNTCHIRDKAKEKVYHEIGRIKKAFRSKYKPLVIIAGCVAQAENQEMLRREPYIDLVIGPQSYHKINDTILNHFQKKRKMEETEFDAISKFKYFSKIKNEAGKVSSFLTIQEGCDKFCHFCVVPYTRGPEYSRPFQQIINEAKYLSEKGAKEIILLERDCDRLVRNDRVIWATSMVACGDADGAVTGNTRRFGSSLEKIKQVVDVRKGEIMFGLNMVVHKGKTIFIGDTSVHEYPTSDEMAEIAISAARVVRLFGFDPKVAFVSHSTFGQPLTSRTKHIRNAVDILKDKKVDFEFDGDMQPDVALNPEYKELYPFAKIVGKANILIMPGQHSAAISYKLMKSLGDAKVIGPLLIGLGLPIEIAPLRSSTSEIINLASIAAYSSEIIKY